MGFLGEADDMGGFLVWVFGAVDEDDDEVGGGNGVVDLGLDVLFEVVFGVF